MSDEKPKPKAKRTTRHGNGAGWGGPAKGFKPNPNAKQDFSAGTNAQGHTIATPASLNRAEIKRQRAEEMEDVLYGIARASERDSDRIQAATRLHAIYEGTPVAKQDITLNTPVHEMTEKEIDALIARSSTLLAGASGEEEAP